MIWDFQNKIQFTLCSQSPRRWDILKNSLLVSHLQTKICHNEDELKLAPEEWNRDGVIAYNQKVAQLKAQSVDFERKFENGIVAEVIIGADSIIAQKDYLKIYEKAIDRSHAKSIISRLSELKEHYALTSVSFRVLTKSGAVYEDTFTEETLVKFYALNDTVIDAYLDQNDWQGKAGAYGIQVAASSIIEKIDGSFFNVLGFPVALFAQKLQFLREIIAKEVEKLQ